VRFNHYGGWGDSGGQVSPSDASEAIDYGSEILVDIEANFQINDYLRVAVGGDNVFDTFPDEDGHFVSGLLGIKYALTSPFGYGRLLDDTTTEAMKNPAKWRGFFCRLSGYPGLQWYS
jgi:hypothetical protein